MRFTISAVLLLCSISASAMDRRNYSGASKVSKAGDTMTGALTLTSPSGSVVSAASVTASGFFGGTGKFGPGTLQWNGNAGSDSVVNSTNNFIANSSGIFVGDSNAVNYSSVTLSMTGFGTSTDGPNLYVVGAASQSVDAAIIADRAQARLVVRDSIGTPTLFVDYSSGSINAPIQLDNPASNKSIGQVSYRSYRAATNAYTTGSNIINQAEPGQTDSIRPTTLVFQTTPQSATAGTKMVITSTGNVGINITAPDQRLDVRDAPGTPQNSGVALGGQQGVLTIGASSVHNGGFYMGFWPTLQAGTWMQTGNRNDLSQTEPLTINPLGGNVGISTGIPASTLDVNGSAQFGTTPSSFTTTGQLKLSNGVTGGTAGLIGGVSIASVTLCGGGATAAGSVLGGKITTGTTAVATCVLTWTPAFSNGSVVYWQDQSRALTINTIASGTTSSTVTWSANWTAGDTLAFHVMGY